MNKFVKIALITLLTLFISNLHEVIAGKSDNANGNEAPTPNTENTPSQITPKDSIKPSFLHGRSVSNKYPFYCYYIGSQNKEALKSPLKIKLIKLNNNELIFDNSANLPNCVSWSIDVYTCSHNVPLLIRFNAYMNYYLYSPNPNTGKWAKYAINGLKQLEQADNSNNLYYSVSNSVDINKLCDVIAEELSKLSGKLCNQDHTGEAGALQALPIVIHLNK